MGVISVGSTVRRLFGSSRVASSLIGLARPLYRSLRARWLRLRHPNGGFVTGNGVQVFCDFENPAFAWYDADAPHLGFDKRVIHTVLAQTDGTVLIDIGAHFGFYAAVFAEEIRKRGGKLIAVEPDPASFRCLERTAGQYRDVESVLLPYAISDEDGELQMFRAASGPCLHSYEEEGAAPAATVRAATLDTIVAEHVRPGERIAMIKVDVDGAEPFFMRGATRTLAQHDPIVFIEFSPSNLRSSGHDPRAFFAELCAGREVYWLSYERLHARRVTLADYGTIAAEVGEAVTDLILAPSTLHLAI